MTVKKTLSTRRYVINIIIIAIGIIFLVRLFYIQIIDKSYKTSAEKNVLRYLTEYPARGLIYDRNGKILVYNEATYDLMVTPIHVVNAFDTNLLCNITGIEKETFIKKMIKARNYSDYLPSIIEEKLSKETYSILQEKLFSFPGFFIQSRTIRNYPQPVAAHILGYLGEVTPELIEKDEYYKPGDYVGISGIEKFYEHELRGRKGKKVIMVDVHGRDKGRYKEGKFDFEAISGLNLYTSIDVALQTYGEELMKNKRGSIVAIEPSTGEILAMISSPSYDPSLLVGKERAKNYFDLLKDKNLPLFNRALSGKYPPGSAFKTIVGLVAEEEGIITPETRFPCFGGFPLGNGKSVGCHTHYSPLDLPGAVQHSCNAYFCRTLKNTIENKKFKTTKQGFNEWRKIVMSFALGKQTGIDLPNESTGNIPTSNYYDKIFGKDRWRALSVISIAIGQGEIQLTPLQMANIAAIIANKGYFYTPHIVRAVGDKNQANPLYRKKKYTLVHEKYYDAIIHGMYYVVEAGTAHSIRMEDIKVCGKTGTVQNAGKNHSVFIAFAPKDNPQIAVAAVVENSGAGATWAAPVSSLIIEKYINKAIKRTELEQYILTGKTIE